ncbi:MAG: L-glutamate gamma-semialdehyde dehydrogenase [Saprospiraceae bacterium]
MSNAIFDVPVAMNEPVLSYAPGSPEKEELKKALKAFKGKKTNIPMFINGKKVNTKNKVEIRPPHEHAHVLGHYSKGDGTHVKMAINAALKAQENWANMPWEHRAAIFLKAAELLAGPYRAKMNAATMLGQSKNVYQAEIDAVAEFCDFLRYNAQFMTEIYSEQPESAPGIWNRMEHRPLEGFIFAITPFNFTSIAGNLCAAPAMLGNTIVWKPAETQIFSAAVIMEIFEEAGLPAGVINLIYTDGPVAGDIIFEHPDLAGLHFTGSTKVFQNLWQTIGNNISKYKSYPRVVGETGGKDFIVAHRSADPKIVATAMSRGAFEFQGQKCSAASRAYIPSNLWSAVSKRLVEQVSSFNMGTPEDFTNFINAVIDERAFDKISGYIAKAKKAKKAEILIGGKYDKSKGYFIEPTVIVTTDPHYLTMEEEIFGPVLTVYVYDPKKFEETLEIVDKTSPYALTGAVFAKDREAIQFASDKLKNAAGNFYINDKPTGAVVGQQPFGGGRGSGTNDKAGSILNLFRWISPRTIKESFVPAVDYRYPFLSVV